MRKLFLLLVSFSVVFYIGCSSSEEQTKNESENEIQKEEYVFDNAVGDTIIPAEVKIETPVAESVKKYIVQLGAFTTKARADERAAFAKKKLVKEIVVSFSEEFKLYVVQLKPFATEAEARTARNELWNSKDFKDAFIVVTP